MTKQSSPVEQISFRERSHGFKLKVVQEIENGLISRNFAAKKYLATRSTIEYWCKKIGTDMNDPNNHSLKKENKKLKKENEELKLLTDIRMDIIDALIKEMGEEAAKKLYPKQLIEEVEKDGQKLKVKVQAQLFGITRQALHKRKKTIKKSISHKQQICSMVKTVRQLLPRAGTRKLHDIMAYSLNNRGIFIGRDKLFKLFRQEQLLVPKRKRYFFTTNSKHRFYKHPNKAKDLIVTKPEQLWVSDITYIKSQQGNMYLSLITDAFSRKIMGYHLADHLKATGPIEALKMGLKNRKYPDRKLMHHSDKGIQYCCDAYIKILTDNEIDISMTSKYDPYENAIAERINGTIKNEFELDCIFPNQTYAKREIAKTVRIYNTLRPHLSCQMQTPEIIHNDINPDPIKLKTKQIWESILFNNFNSN